MSLYIAPCSLREANGFIQQFHRHNGAVLVARLVAAVKDQEHNIRGVGIAGTPRARKLDDGQTIEIYRVCTDGAKNACSILYATLWRAARAIGYTSLITYTLTSEPGSSIKAIGASIESVAKAHEWSCKSRPRQSQQVYGEDKYRWRVRCRQ